MRPYDQREVLSLIRNNPGIASARARSYLGTRLSRVLNDLIDEGVVLKDRGPLGLRLYAPVPPIRPTLWQRILDMVP